MILNLFKKPKKREVKNNSATKKKVFFQINEFVKLDNWRYFELGWKTRSH